MDEELQWTEFNPPEKVRIYHFPELSITIENVTRLCVRPSGNHRVESADGWKYIVAPGWYAIEINADKWTL